MKQYSRDHKYQSFKKLFHHPNQGFNLKKAVINSSDTSLHNQSSSGIKTWSNYKDGGNTAQGFINFSYFVSLLLKKKYSTVLSAILDSDIPLHTY